MEAAGHGGREGVAYVRPLGGNETFGELGEHVDWCYGCYGGGGG